MELEDLDDDADDHLEDDEEEDEEGGSERLRLKHKKIPTWQQAIDAIIAVNMESRAKNPGGGGWPRPRPRAPLATVVERAKPCCDRNPPSPGPPFCWRWFSPRC